MRATYRELISPVAQLVAAKDFVDQMESVVADEWRESEDPKDRAKHESESAQDFLTELEDEGFVHEVLAALDKLKLRFEVDGEDEGDGYFSMECRGSPHDVVLHRYARAFAKQVDEFAPEGWSLDNTIFSLAWENMLLVHDDDGSIKGALKLLREDG